MEKTGNVKSSVAYDSQVEGSALISEKEGTANDMKDMRRMGKHQSLRVGPSEMRSPATTLISSSQAKLWFPIHLRLFHDSDEYLGDSTRVSKKSV